MPPTSQLEWLSSTTAMIVEGSAQVVRLGHRGTPSLDAATKLPFLAARPIASIGPAAKETAVERALRQRIGHEPHGQDRTRSRQWRHQETDLNLEHERE